MDNYTQIYLKDYGYLDVVQDIPVPLNLSLAEVKDISKRNSSFSKTIILPGTRNNNEKLGLIFDINVAFNDCTFKINRKVEAVIFQNGQPVLSGWFKLININKISPSDISFDENIQYECIVFSNQAGIYDRIKDLDIEDINLSGFNHTLSFSSITATTTHTYVNGYKYIWHYTSEDKYRVGDFRPAVYIKTIWDAIFTKAGFTYTGSFPNQEPFTKLLLPTNTRDLLISDAEVAKREMRVSFASGFTALNRTRFVKTPRVTITSNIALYGTNQSSNLTAVNFVGFNVTIGSPLTFNDDTTDINFDGGYNNYNTTTNVFTAPKTGQYEMDLNLAGIINITAPQDVFFPERVFGRNRRDNRLLTDMGEPAISYVAEFLVQSAGTTSWNVVNSFFKYLPIEGVQQPVPQYFSTGTQPVYPSGVTSYNYTFICPKFLLDLNIGDKVAIKLKIYTYQTSIVTTQYYSLASQRNKALTYEVNINSYNPQNSYWAVKAVKNNLTTGDEINFNDLIPKKIKQVDFIKSLVNMFNLYLITDEDNPSNIIIKTRDEYYADFANQYLDWTDKIDYSQEYQIQLLSELQNKTINFTYKEPKDEVNIRYKEQSGFLYGQYRLNFDNDFLNGEQRIELMFEPTPLVKTLVPLGSEGFTFIVPYLVYQNNTNPKILYDGGTISVSGYTLVDGATNYTLNYYNYAGHFDNPTEPTFDINWNTNEFYFYNEVLNNLTDNNLFNKYWYKYIELISESKLLTAFFNLNEYDIASINFAKLIWIRDSYWYINRIVDYNANNDGLTKVELIKALDTPVFNPKIITRSPILVDTQTIRPDARTGGSRLSDNVQIGFTRNNNFGQNVSVIGFDNNVLTGVKNSRVLGNGNLVGSGSQNVFIDGNNNFVGGGSNRITISGNGNKIFGGSANISLINCDNITLVSAMGDISLTNMDNQILDFTPSKTYISPLIYIQDGLYINNSQVVDAGLDYAAQIQSQLTFPQSLVDNGKDITYVINNVDTDLLNGTVNGNQIDYEQDLTNI